MENEDLLEMKTLSDEVGEDCEGQKADRLSDLLWAHHGELIAAAIKGLGLDGK